MQDIITHLEERGFIYQLSDPELRATLLKEQMTVYAGFDPSDSSLHLGHLIPIIGLMHFQRAGHRPIAVVGGATGMIGDPSGRDQERQLLSVEQLRENQNGIRKQLERFLDFDDPKTGALLVNNYDWTSPYDYLTFLREIGKHFSVNVMIAKESVKKRLESRDQGLSYTEFSYQILQAFDFHYLWKTYGCKLQIGGSDQWGNITAGIDLNRRMGGDQLYGITFPLLMTADGKKFGKSEGNAIWLDAIRAKPYELFQYFIQTDDADVTRFLKLFTFLTIAQITDLEQCVKNNPEQREAQKTLAREVTRIVHGESGLKSAEGATRILFGSEPIQGYDDETLTSIFADIPSTSIAKTQLQQGIPLIDMLVTTGMCSSKSDARRSIASGGIYCNNIRIAEPDRVLNESDLASSSILVLRSGKKKYHLVKLTA